MKIKRTAVDRSFDVIDVIFLILLAGITILPLLNVLANSLSEPMSVYAGRVTILPRNFSLNSYRSVMKYKMVWTGFANSLFYAAFGTLINLALTTLCAFPLSRKEFAGRGVLTFVFAFTMLFSGGMIPSYLLVRSLHLMDTRLAMLLPGAMSVWNMVIMRTFFQNGIPTELYESAELDGAGDVRLLFSIVLPLSGSILAVLALFYVVGHWNAYFSGLLYLKSESLFSLQMVLRNALQNASVLYNMIDVTEDMVKTAALSEALKYAIIVIAILPVMLAYPFVQKHFIKGVMIGSLKG